MTGMLGLCMGSSGHGSCEAVEKIKAGPQFGTWGAFLCGGHARLQSARQDPEQCSPFIKSP